MSILAREIIGRGALFGRFEGEEIVPMTQYWGTELALRAARYYRADLPEVMAPVVADRCGGNPFYITAVVRQAAKQQKVLKDEGTLNEVLAVDISSGFIWVPALVITWSLIFTCPLISAACAWLFVSNHP